MEEIGNNLLELRKKCDFTQVEVADKLGTSYQAVSNWERGVSMPDISKLNEISQLYSVSIDTILLNSPESEVVKCLNKNEFNKKITVQEFVNLIPILKPTQLRGISVNLIVESAIVDINLTLNSLPHIPRDVANRLVLKVLESSSDIVEVIAKSYPFVDKDTTDKLVKKALLLNNKIEDIVEVIFPFVSSKVADELIDYCLKNNIKKNYVLTNGIYFGGENKKILQ